MKRIALPDGRWFNPDHAEFLCEHRDWDGKNHISRNTGSQWDHHSLCRTAGGTWILRTWSDRDGSEDTYCIISHSKAASWLILNEHEIPDDLAEIVDSLEVK